VPVGLLALRKEHGLATVTVLSGDSHGGARAAQALIPRAAVAPAMGSLREATLRRSTLTDNFNLNLVFCTAGDSVKKTRGFDPD
jgi:hypothetical protein